MSYDESLSPFSRYSSIAGLQLGITTRVLANRQINDLKLTAESDDSKIQVIYFALDSLNM